MRTPFLLALVVATSVIAAAASARATVADDLCAPTDDPCVLSGAVTIDPGSTIDLTGRGLQLAPTAKVSWTGTVTVTNAAHCDFQAGSTLTEKTATGGNPLLWLYCTQATLAGTIKTLGAGILVEGSGFTDGPYVVSGKIKAKGDQVGVIAIDAIGGDITVTGKIQAKSKVGTPPGEFRLMSNFGNIVVALGAKIQMKGATADPFTEFFIVEAGTGTLTIDGAIDAGAKTGAYAFNLEANDAVSFGAKSKIKAKAHGKGPEMAINSQVSTVTLRGKIQAKTKDPSFGDGPKVRVCAGNDIVMESGSSIDASTGGFDGSIIIGAFDSAHVSAGAKLFSKTDGDIEVCGGTSGFISSDAKVVPYPEAVGAENDAFCLSPTSQVIFDLDCNPY